MKRNLAIVLCAALLCWPAAASCQSLAEAKAFVTGLYTAYAAGDPDYLGPKGRTVFSPRLWRLIRRDQIRSHGEVGALDGDPICDCQDHDRLANLQVSVTAQSPGRVSAEVRFKNLGQAEQVKLDLTSVQGRWKVDDVHSPGMASLAGLLTGAK